MYNELMTEEIAQKTPRPFHPKKRKRKKGKYDADPFKPEPNIYAYVNFRDFLKDFIEFKKDTGIQQRFSYRAFSKYLGYTSPSIMRMIIKGIRNLPEDRIEKLGELLKLGRKESQFFKNMVYFNQSPSLEDKQKFFEKICIFKAYQEIRSIDHLTYQYFSKWFYPVIREMVQMADFKPDPRWIVRFLSNTITVEEADEGLQTLIKLGLLVPDEEGRLKPVDKNIISDTEVGYISLVSFHIKMIEKAKESISATPHEFRELISVTVPVNEESFKETKKRLQELAEEFAVVLSKTKEVEAVYQLNFQFFNMTPIPPHWGESNKKKGEQNDDKFTS